MKKIVVISAILLCNSIAFAERSRVISTDEYLFALSLFPREFPAQYEITITDGTSPTNGAYYVRPSIGGVIGAGYIRMNMGNLYDNCLADKSIFAHELTHAWQIQHYGLPWYIKEFVANQVYCATLIKRSPYNYTCDQNKKLSDYNAEVQGEVVSKYYLKSPCETNIAQRALSSTTWKLMIGNDGKDIAKSDNGNLYLTNTTGKIFQYNGRDWTQLPGTDARCIAANNNKVVMTNSAGKIYQLINNSWQQMSGSDASDVAINSDGTIWMTNRVGKIYKYTGSSWQQMQGSDAKRIAAGFGQVFMTNTAGKIYKYNGNGWSQITGSDGMDITVAGPQKYFLTNTVGKIYQWNGTGAWSILDGSDGVSISASNGKLVMINTAGRIFTLPY
mgnify:CR=1 FL=1